MIEQNNNLKFALFGNLYQEKKAVAVQKFLAVAERHKVELAIQAEFHDFLVNNLQITVPQCEIIEDDNFQADFVVCMGGDGTFLNVASQVKDKEIPIIGFNTGRLGFLASFSPENIEDTITDICSGNYTVNNHAVLQASMKGAELGLVPFALNEVALLKHDISSMISIHTTINGEYLTTYMADGLIIGTPTGSTAYSLSVGGPIVVPEGNIITLTPVAPHSLNMRPIVLTDSSEVELTVQSRSGSFLVAIDGRSQSYPDNIVISVKKADYVVKVVTKQGQSFFSTLRRKMMWGADSRG
ncbi:MAG: NAD kinase [Bacteroidaceae bacterium]|nr:NAD kinase [Bacteroidaceae bacterium]